MAIYGWKAADVYAGKPPGEWQVLEATVVGNHITATLNGKRVHGNAVLPAMTGGALDNDEMSPGPIMIQGDHSRVCVPETDRDANYPGGVLVRVCSIVRFILESHTTIAASETRP